MTDVNVSAGDVSIDEAYITHPEAGSIDILNFIMQFDVYMSVDANSMTAEVQIADAAGLITAIPILGQELLTLSFKTPNIDEPFTRTFVIHTISNRSLNRDREQLYTLECITEEGYRDTSSRVFTKFSGSTDEIAQQIFDDIKNPAIQYANGKKSDDVILELLDTPFVSNNFEFNSNFWSPFKCLNFLASRSRGATSSKTNVLFFERKGSYAFTSLEYLTKLQKDKNSIYDEYTVVESQDAPNYEDTRDKTYKYQTKYLNSTYHTIQSTNYPIFKSLLLNNLTGFHATSIFSYDFTTKRMVNMKYDNRPEAPDLSNDDKKYIVEDFSKFEPMGEFNTINANTLADPNAHRAFSPMMTSLYGTSYSRDVEQIRNQLVRNFSMSELDNNYIEIVVPGKSDVNVGMLCRLVFPKTDDKTDQPDIDDLEDPYVSGIYMIIAVKHSIQPNNHKMTLRLMRDSFGG